SRSGRRTQGGPRWRSACRGTGRSMGAAARSRSASTRLDRRGYEPLRHVARPNDVLTSPSTATGRYVTTLDGADDLPRVDGVPRGRSRARQRTGIALITVEGCLHSLAEALDLSGSTGHV